MIKYAVKSIYFGVEQKTDGISTLRHFKKKYSIKD